MKLPQFHLRDLFWLVLVIAIMCAWWLDHGRLAAEASKVMRAIIRSSFCLDQVGDEYELVRCGKPRGTVRDLPRPQTDSLTD